MKSLYVPSFSSLNFNFNFNLYFNFIHCVRRLSLSLSLSLSFVCLCEMIDSANESFICKSESEKVNERERE